jgi:uncharacterized membrane protein
MVILAEVGSGLYELLLFLHILAVVVAFSPAVVHALTGPKIMKDDETAGRAFSKAAAANSRIVYLPALLAVGILGFALVGVSDPAFKFTQAWVYSSALLWLAIGGIVSAVIIPGEKQVAAGDRAAESRVAAGGGIATLLFLIVLFLMVVKPGI